MCQGRLYHSVCLHFLLIAIAIQGVTPDPQDLASNNCLRLFCPALGDPNALADDDGMPDDVCVPAASEIESLLHGRSESLDPPCRMCPSTEFDPLAVHLRAARPGQRVGNQARSDQLIYSVCRLNC